MKQFSPNLKPHSNSPLGINHQFKKPGEYSGKVFELFCLKSVKSDFSQAVSVIYAVSSVNWKYVHVSLVWPPPPPPHMEGFLL
jgi:hypothetical protein